MTINRHLEYYFGVNYPSYCRLSGPDTPAPVERVTMPKCPHFQIVLF